MTTEGVVIQNRELKGTYSYNDEFFQKPAAILTYLFKVPIAWLNTNGVETIQRLYKVFGDVLAKHAKTLGETKAQIRTFFSDGAKWYVPYFETLKDGEAYLDIHLFLVGDAKSDRLVISYLKGYRSKDLQLDKFLPDETGSKIAAEQSFCKSIIKELNDAISRDLK